MRFLKDLFLLVSFLSFCAGGEKPGEPRDMTFNPKETVIAIANGIEIRLSDLEREIKANRFGGSVELIMDELVSFALVLKEREVLKKFRIDGSSLMPGTEKEADFTKEAGSLREEGEAFLNTLFSKEAVCVGFDEKKVSETFDALWGRRIPFDKNFNDPGVREEVESFLCEKERKRVIRQYLKDLRKNAIITIDWKKIRELGY